MQNTGTIVDNKFIGGLKTDFTALNFPDNACIDADNSTFDLIGNVTRRLGVDFEAASTTDTVDRTSKAISTFVWTNVGGDGSTKVLVRQIGGVLYFFRQTDATLLAPLSTTKLVSTITLTDFSPSGGASPVAVECQYASGNGYLFVFHPNLDPFYCVYNAGTITGKVITVQIRDIVGIPDNLADNYRPLTLSAEHTYNLYNQGWSNSPAWSAASSSTQTYATGSRTFTVAAGLSITPGDSVAIHVFVPGLGGSGANGTVTSYTTTTLVINITSLGAPAYSGTSVSNWTFTKLNAGLITTWNSAIGNYPSNADVWWVFKNASNVFDPATTYANTTLASSPAPKGAFILNAFDQNRTVVSSVAGITTVTTLVRPRTGVWFQGRVWYTGADASFQATGDAPYTTWTESIYFSQIAEKVDQFGLCYDINDPTSETLFDLLPTDGGVIVIQGTGPIYKLFPIQNGLLVFSANGIWFITGSQGIGFSANDYTITKISEVQCISSSSFVNVLGYPVFWNEEGIYSCSPGKQGGLEVKSISVGEIGAFYRNIPLNSKKYARGVYNPIEYTIQWCYKSAEETTVTSRYEFDKILNFNTITSAYYPWTISTGVSLNGLNYIVGPGGSTSPDPVTKFLVSYSSAGSYKFTFAEERDTTYTDWASFTTPVDYTSYFITGYRVYGKGNTFGDLPYIDIHAVGSIGTSCLIQSRWDSATSGSTGRWSTQQVVTFDKADRAFETKRRRTRGQGRVVQLKFTSISGAPMSLIGWSTLINVNKTP